MPPLTPIEIARDYINAVTRYAIDADDDQLCRAYETVRAADYSSPDTRIDHGLLISQVQSFLVAQPGPGAFPKTEAALVERVAETVNVDMRLAVRVGVDSGKGVRISEAEAVTIGRGDDAVLRLSDPLVSATHCRVVVVRPPAGPCPHCGVLAEAGDAHCVGCGRQRIAAEVEDLGSAIGVLVDGTPVPKHGRADLLEGGEIQIGDTIIVFGSEADPVHAGPAPTVIRRSRDQQFIVSLVTSISTAGSDLMRSIGVEDKRRQKKLLAVAGVAVCLLILVVGVLPWYSGKSSQDQYYENGWLGDCVDAWNSPSNPSFQINLGQKLRWQQLRGGLVNVEMSQPSASEFAGRDAQADSAACRVTIIGWDGTPQPVSGGRVGTIAWDYLGGRWVGIDYINAHYIPGVEVGVKQCPSIPDDVGSQRAADLGLFVWLCLESPN